MEINQMLKRQEHFFQSQKTKKYEFRKKALLRLECAIKQHEEDMEHALYKDLGKSSFESYMAEIGMVKSELSYAKKHLKKWMKTEQVRTTRKGIDHSAMELSNSFILTAVDRSDCSRKLLCFKTI